MEDTLESIRPSVNQINNQDMSFLYGRDPSILTHGQLVLPPPESKKNLESLFDEEELELTENASTVPSLSTLSDTIQVFLRLRPLPKKIKLTQQQMDAYKIINSTTLQTKLPSLDSNCSSMRHKSNETVSRIFTFTATFDPDTTQLQLFDQTVKQQMTEFLSGKSATVMSYGTTNAGKSFTLHGTTALPGIIPRSLEFVFNNITPRPTPSYKPLFNTDVLSLNASQRAHEMELKTKLLSFGSIDTNEYIQAYRNMQQLLRDESPIKPSECSNANYSVWVSFAEIYNETIFDLLSNDYQNKRPSLKLATDKRGKPFIKGLKMICVNSGSEAYQLLMAGQYNLKVAATALNSRSSRSHCIFTIKLLKYHTENSPADVEVSTFSFCDLAGSERLKKTLNAGDRLKEAQNINTSLLVLGRCFKSIFEMQSANLKLHVTGPFRESKLTRLFQCALSGKEHITLIVNVNPVPNLYMETQNVLNFAAIAKQIVIVPVKRVKRRASTSRFSQLVSQSVKTVTDWDITKSESIPGEKNSCTIEENSEYNFTDDYNDVVRENEKLRKQVRELKNAVLMTDFATRAELADMYSTMIKNLETNYKNRLQDSEERQEDMLQWSVKQVENYYKAKLSKLSSRKRGRTDDYGDSEDTDDETGVEELMAENEKLITKVNSLKKSVKELCESKEKLLIENNHNAFELSLAKKDLEKCQNLLHAAESDIGCNTEANKVIEELKKQLSASEDNIKSLKSYLNDAKAEWIRIVDIESDLEEALKKKDAEVMESSEKIDDLTEQIEYANVCLAEKTKAIDILEDKLDLYATELADTKEYLQDAEDKWNKSAANNLVIKEENEKLQKMLDEEILRNKIATNSSSENNQRIEELSKELDEAKQELLSRETLLKVSEQKITEYKDSLESVTNELHNCNSQLGETNKKLQDVKQEKEDLANKALALENELKDIYIKNRQNSEALEENSKKIAALEAELSDKVEKIKEISSKCLTEHIDHIKKLEKNIASAEERQLIKEQVSQAHMQRISKLEKDLEEVNDLRGKLTAHENQLEECKREKLELGKQLDEKCEKLVSLQNELEAAVRREQEKDSETISLQKEMKNMLQLTCNDTKADADMEKEVKNTLRELTKTQKALADSKAAFKNLEVTSQETTDLLKLRIKMFEENSMESERLRTDNDRIRQELEEKKCEMESFCKNRDEVIARYETLIRQYQEDIDKSKLEKSESTREEKKTVAELSDDEIISSEPRPIRRRGKIMATPAAANTSITELSTTETKRVTRQTALHCLSSIPSVEKPKPRRKKLFAVTDDVCVDVEPTESTPRRNLRSPLSATRSLRNRRK